MPWLRKHVDPNAQRVKMPAKLKYVMPLDREMREQLLPIAQPYVKKSSAGSIASDVPTIQVGEGGATPTSALHLGVGSSEVAANFSR